MKLALNNEAVQLQVCADYNFHSEEEFKLNYWKKVIKILSENKKIGPISPHSLKQWWSSSVGRSLPGLTKVLFAITRRNDEFVTLSALRSRYETLFTLHSVSAGNSLSALSRLNRWIWGGLSYSTNKEKEESVEESEIIFSSEILQKCAKQILTFLQSQTGLDGGPLESILVTESDVLKTILNYLKNETFEPPFAHLPNSHLCVVVMVVLVDACKAIPFQISEISCLKLPLVDASTSTTPLEDVSDRDRAFIVSRIASEKLMAQESSLGVQWTAADEKIKQHLASGRKALAVTALKERKMIEERMEEIQIFKLKLAECNSLTQTAVIQQAVIDAIAIGCSATKTVATSAEQIEEIIEEATELRNQVKEVSVSIAGTQEEDDEAAILLEYEKLIKDQRADQIDIIPSPPTTAPPLVAVAPKIAIIPEEWINEH